MSKINDKLIEAEESEGDICWFAGESWHDHCPYCKADKQMQKWREETRKLDELAEQWNGVYQQIDGVIGKQGVKNEQS